MHKIRKKQPLKKSKNIFCKNRSNKLQYKISGFTAASGSRKIVTAAQAAQAEENEGHPMKILIVTSEAVPFAKTGGLADAVPALASAMSKSGHDVRIVMPRYYSIDRNSLEELPSGLGVPMGGGETRCAIFKTSLPDTEVPVYFLDEENLYGRSGLYGPDGSSSWPDNDQRYAFLSAASFQLCRYLNWIPDILHSHDWQSAPAAWLLALRERNKEFANTASVLTVHNLGYQGIFPASALGVFDDDFQSRIYSSGNLQFEEVNFLAAGLAHADQITTVSPTYAQEILRDEYSEGLGQLLNSRKESITGILNGMDYSEWNPASDSALKPYNFDVKSIKKKSKVKEMLQKEMKLPVNPGIPLFGMVSRLTGQKGIDLLIDTLGPGTQAFREGRAQLAILGSGEKHFEDAMKNLALAFPASVSVRLAFSGPLSRLIEGGSDFFLMPSRYEPCGLNQMYSLRYGTLPVVRHTGGLADTVKDLNANPDSGNGFVFQNCTGADMGHAINRAVEFFTSKKEFKTARKRAMQQRFDWESSAEEYLAVYRKALGA